MNSPPYTSISDYDSDYTTVSQVSVSMSQISNVQNNHEEHKKELEEKDKIIKEMQEIIEKQKKIIGNQIDNTDNVNKLIKLIKIIYGYAEMAYYLDEIFIYGSLFEKLFQKKSLENTKLYFLFPKLNEFYFYKFVESLHDMDCVLNDDDYNRKKRSFVSMNNQLLSINHWDLKIQLNDDIIIDVIFHDNTYTENIVFDCQNIVLTKTGFTIKTFTEIDNKNKRKLPSLSLLHNMNNILNNQTNISVLPDTHNQIKLFETIENQNDLIKEGYNINTGFIVNDEEEETCAICYREHKEDNEAFLYRLKCTHSFCSECLYKHMANHQLNNHNNCPLCRQQIQIGIRL